MHKPQIKVRTGIANLLDLIFELRLGRSQHGPPTATGKATAATDAGAFELCVSSGTLADIRTASANGLTQEQVPDNPLTVSRGAHTCPSADVREALGAGEGLVVLDAGQHVGVDAPVAALDAQAPCSSA